MKTKKKKKYLINGETFTQGPLVLGQLMPLCDMLEGLRIKEITVQGIVKALGAKLPMALAVVLAADGEDLRDRDLEARATMFEAHASLETTLEVVADFLSLNPTSSILERIRVISGGVKKMWGDGSRQPSKTSSTKLPEGTLQNGTGCSGTSP
jgi:hypothetical protein